MVSVLPQASFVNTSNQEGGNSMQESSSHLLLMNQNQPPDSAEAMPPEQRDQQQQPEKEDKPVPDESPPSSEHKNRANSSMATTNNIPPALSSTTPNKESGKYLMVRTIGKGNFAKVKLAVHMATGVEVAIKIINKTQMKHQLLSRLKREIDIMKLTNHPNIVKLLEIIETEDVLCLVMEYASGGEIFDYLVTNGQISEHEARAKFRQLVSAIHYCHSKKIVHRDLKAENILLDRKLDVKVADFGLANLFERDGHLKTFCGSPPYAAPELFLGVPYFGPCVDIWSLGVILYTIVVGHLPFEAKDLRELKAKVLSLSYNFPKNSVSPEFKSIVGKMLILDPRKRSTLKTIMDHPWMNIGYDNEPLRPFDEPKASDLDPIRVDAMRTMNYTQQEIENSVVRPKFDHIYATYQLLSCIPSEILNECHAQISVTSETSGKEPLLKSSNGSCSTMGGGEQTSMKQQPSTNTTVGRFTVQSSTRTSDSSESTSSPKKLRASSRDDLNSTQSTRSAPLNIPAQEQQHHSFTAASSMGLRKAFYSMGRNLTMMDKPGQPHPETLQEHSIQPQKNNNVFKRNPKNYMLSLTTAPVPMLLQQQQHRGSNKNASTGGGIIPAPASLGGSPPSSVASPLLRRGSLTPSALATQAAQVPNFNVNTTPPKVSLVNQPTSTTTWHSGNTRMLPLLQRHFKEQQAPPALDLGSQPHQPASLTAGETSGRQTPHKNSQLPPLLPAPPHIEEELVGNSSATVRYNSSFSGGLPTKHEPKPTKGRFHISKTSENIDTISDHSSVPMNAANCHGAGGEMPHHHRSSTRTWLNKTITGLFNSSKSTKTPGIRQLSVASKMSKQPCEAVFPWSMSSTSTKPPQMILESAKAALSQVAGVRWVMDPQMPFLLHCSWKPQRPSVQNAKLEWARLKEVPEVISEVGELEMAKMSLDKKQSWEDEHMKILDPDDPIVWEMHVCKLQQTSLCGIRLNRIRGAAIEYKKIASEVMKAMNL